MGIKSPYICEIAPDTYAINEFGLAAMYLLVGQEQALLIDTGCGVCDLKGVIRSLTEKPYIVAATHGHFDHVGGIGCFDEVYLNEKDHDLARTFTPEEVRSYADSFGKSGGYQIFDYSIEAITEIVRFPFLLPLTEGDCFNLGGRVVEAFEIPGHTDGGIAFLDVNNRIMFSGDCCNVNLLTPNCSVATTLTALQKFRSLTTRFDQNFNGHVGYKGSAGCMSQPKEVVDDLLHICISILEKTAVPESFEFIGYTFTQVSHGCARLSYDPDRLAEEEREHGK